MTPAFPPPGQELVQLLLLARVQRVGAVVDPLAVKPYAQRAFVDIASLLVPRPVPAGCPDSPDLLQPLLPAPLVIGFARGRLVPAGDDRQRITVNRGKGPLGRLPPAVRQPGRESASRADSPCLTGSRPSDS